MGALSLTRHSGIYPKKLAMNMTTHDQCSRNSIIATEKWSPRCFLSSWLKMGFWPKITQKFTHNWVNSKLFDHGNFGVSLMAQSKGRKFYRDNSKNRDLVVKNISHLITTTWNQKFVLWSKNRPPLQSLITLFRDIACKQRYSLYGTTTVIIIVAISISILLLANISLAISANHQYHLRKVLLTST